jgi:hypothetical protein
MLQQHLLVQMRSYIGFVSLELLGAQLAANAWDELGWLTIDIQNLQVVDRLDRNRRTWLALGADISSGLLATVLVLTFVVDLQGRVVESTWALVT